MSLFPASNTPPSDTTIAPAISQDLSFEEKLQTHTRLLSKSLFKLSTIEVDLLCDRLFRDTSEVPNIPSKSIEKFGKTLTWRQELMRLAHREIFEWARSSIDRSSFIPGEVSGQIGLLMEMLFIELIRINPQTQILDPIELRTATEISYGCSHQLSSSRILVKNTQLLKSLTSMYSGVRWALEILALYRDASPSEQELVSNPFVPIDPNQVSTYQLADPKVFHRALLDIMGPIPSTPEAQGLLQYSTAVTLWMSIYDGLTWFIQFERVIIGPKGNCLTNICLHRDLHLAILAWQMLEQYHKYQSMGADTIRNIILNEKGYPNGSLADFVPFSYIPLEQICRGFKSEHKKLLIALIHLSPERFWDTGSPRESLVWFLREKPQYIERALSFLKQLSFQEISNAEFLRMLELWVSGRQIKSIRTADDVAKILSPKSPIKLELIPLQSSQEEISTSISAQIEALPSGLVLTMSIPGKLATTPLYYQQERLTQLQTKYHLPELLSWTESIEKELIDACFTYAKRSHRLSNWNPAQYVTIVREALEAASQEPLIRYHTGLTIRSTLQTQYSSHSFDEATRLILLSGKVVAISQRKNEIVNQLTELLWVIHPRKISSTNSNREVGTGGVAEAITDRLKSMLPSDRESDSHYLLRTLSFEWLTIENRSTLEKQADKRAIRVISALHEHRAVGLFECITAIARLAETLHMDHNRVTGASVQAIVIPVLRKWTRQNRSEVIKK
jgi:hypothetical protein